MTDKDRNSRRLRYAKFQFCFLGLSIFSWLALKLPSWRTMWVSLSGSCSRWRRSATVTRSPWGTMRNNRAVGGVATFATRTDVKDTRRESSNFTLWLPNSPENYRSWPEKRFLVRCDARLFLPLWKSFVSCLGLKNQRTGSYFIVGIYKFPWNQKKPRVSRSARNLAVCFGFSSLLCYMVCEKKLNQDFG